MIWLKKVVWRFRRKRYVRLHLTGIEPSFEGVLVGRWGGHYVLYGAKLIQSEAETTTIDGIVEVPTEKVLFLQHLTEVVMA